MMDDGKSFPFLSFTMFVQSDSFCHIIGLRLRILKRRKSF